MARGYAQGVSPLPARGPEVRRLGLVLPPRRMALRSGARPLKRWRYVGVFTPELMLCVGDARVGPLPLRWWAIALPDGSLFERTTIARGGVRVERSRVRVDAPHVSIDLALDEGEGVETATPTGPAFTWTRKQAAVEVHGTVTLGGRECRVGGRVAVVDESAGYHPHRTAWKWSAGVGRTEDGRGVGWNLVAGVHDTDGASERTLWIDGEPRELGRNSFAEDLSSVSFAEGGRLDFADWSAREDHTNLLAFRSDYRQPFGTFSGTLPGGLALAHGCGVMEEHEVRW